MVKFNAFSRLKNIFSRLNPIPSFAFDESEMEIIKPFTSDELLQNVIKECNIFEKVILIAIYHLINTQKVDKEYLTVLTKDLKLIEDLSEGDKNEVNIPDYVKYEGLCNNLLVACHNHFFGAVVPSCEDILSSVLYNCQFSVISSENHMAILYNNFNSKDINKLKRELMLFDAYIEFCFSIECSADLNALDELDLDFNENKLKLFDKFINNNNKKFIDEFNLRFSKYNIHEIYINL